MRQQLKQAAMDQDSFQKELEDKKMLASYMKMLEENNQEQDDMIETLKQQLKQAAMDHESVQKQSAMDQESIQNEAAMNQSRFQKELKYKKTLVSYMMNILWSNEELMKERESMITEQATMLEKSQRENKDCQKMKENKVKMLSENQELVMAQRENIEQLMEIITNEEAINSSCSNLEAFNPLDSGSDVAAMFHETITEILINQEEEIKKLKEVIKGEKGITTFIAAMKDNIEAPVLLVNTTDQNWDLLLRCQTVVEKQSTGLALMRTMMPPSLSYGEDEQGRLVSARLPAASGTISVPSHFSPIYSPNMNERYLVEVPEGSRIMFTFTGNISLEECLGPSGEQECDFVGIENEDGSRILKNTAKGRPDPVTSKTHRAFVTFHSDNYTEGSGFSLNWEEI